MLTEQNIIYFGDQWDGVLRNRQQLMSIFARQNKVLFVETKPHLRRVWADLRQGKLKTSDLFRSPVCQVSDNLFVFRCPMWAPASGNVPLKQFHKIVEGLSFRNTLRKLALSDPIVWFYHPKWIDWIDKVPSSRLRLYHVVDDYASFQNKTPVRSRQVADLEKQMISQVDVVVVVSKKLYETRHLFNPETYVVPNGVNYEAYSAALAIPHLPAELQAIESPRLGYSGLIGDKLDLDMLKAMAQENPGWSLVFAGPVNASQKAGVWRELKAMPNVHYLGVLEWSQVPYYVKGFDAGLMPYVKSGYSENMSPLKLYDYLAAGIPIAATDLTPVHEFKPYVHLAEGAQDFVQAVRSALADNSVERRQVRRNVAAQHTWEARVEQLSDLIQTQLAANTPLP